MACYFVRDADKIIYCNSCKSPYDTRGPQEPRKLDCIHTFCLSCIQKMQNAGTTMCPFRCEHSMLSDSMKNQTIIRRIIALKKQHLPPGSTKITIAEVERQQSVQYKIPINLANIDLLDIHHVRFKSPKYLKVCLQKINQDADIHLQAFISFEFAVSTVLFCTEPVKTRAEQLVRAKEFAVEIPRVHAKLQRLYSDWVKSVKSNNTHLADVDDAGVCNQIQSLRQTIAKFETTWNGIIKSWKETHDALRFSEWSAHGFPTSGRGLFLDPTWSVPQDYGVKFFKWDPLPKPISDLIPPSK